MIIIPNNSELAREMSELTTEPNYTERISQLDDFLDARLRNKELPTSWSKVLPVDGCLFLSLMCLWRRIDAEANETFSYPQYRKCVTLKNPIKNIPSAEIGCLAGQALWLESTTLLTMVDCQISRVFEGAGVYVCHGYNLHSGVLDPVPCLIRAPGFILDCQKVSLNGVVCDHEVRWIAK